MNFDRINHLLKILTEFTIFGGFCSDIYDKRIHTKKCFYTNIFIAYYAGCSVTRFRHQQKTKKWVVLRIKIAKL